MRFIVFSCMLFIAGCGSGFLPMYRIECGAMGTLPQQAAWRCDRIGQTCYCTPVIIR